MTRKHFFLYNVFVLNLSSLLLFRDFGGLLLRQLLKNIIAVVMQYNTYQTHYLRILPKYRELFIVKG